MEQIAKQQQQFKRRQRFKQWFRPSAYILAVTTILATLGIAIGWISTNYGNWIAVICAIATFIMLIIERKPTKTDAEQFTERVMKQAQAAEKRKR